MKYRLLSQQELELLEEEFKHFLIVNGVHNDEWVEMNKTNPGSAMNMVELFSDTVLQKVYEKAKFIEHRSKSSCMVFKLNTDTIELISINTSGDEVNLSSPESVHNALAHKSALLTIFNTIKPYSKNREEEIHEMIENGCVNSSEAFWLQLKKVL